MHDGNGTDPLQPARPPRPGEPDDRNEIEKAIDDVIEHGGDLVADKDKGGHIKPDR
jgi:hypothetical protein